jgi:hypothetical protein
MRALALVSGRARARAQAQLSDLALVQLSTRMRPDGRKAARIRVAIAGGAAEARGLPGSRCLVRSWLVRRAVQVPGLWLVVHPCACQGRKAVGAICADLLPGQLGLVAGATAVPYRLPWVVRGMGSV